jgi:hypothetical protein
LKFKLFNIILTTVLLVVSSLSSAGIIDSDKYSLTDIDGSFTWGNTNWNLAGTTGYVNNNNDITQVDTLLSDGYVYSTGNNEQVNGIYNWSTAGYHAFTFNFYEETTFNGLDLLISRNNSLLTPFFAEIFDGNNWSNLVSSTTGDLGLTLRPRNQKDITQTLSLDFGSVTGSAIRFGYNNGDQIGLHEVTFNGDISELAFSDAISKVPEPSTFAILALGLIGLTSSRFKKKS